MKTKFLIFSFLLIAHGSTLFAAVEPTDSIEGASYDLEGLVVTADKPLVQSDGAKLTYNMKEDPSSKGNTLIDALRKVPMVSIDGDNNISINGQSNFKIYVNGKEDPALTANYKNIFRAMPADAITKVEVITEPGAKYDAEGTAGILNLVTITDNSTDGYFGTVSATFSKSQTGGSLYGRMKKGKLSISANADYANGSIFKQKNEYVSEIENVNSFSNRFQTSRNQQSIGFDYIGGGIKLSYDLSDKDLITANGNIYCVNGFLNDGNSLFTTTIMNADRVKVAEVARAVDASLSNTGITAGASWQHTFDEAGRKTVLSYLFNHGYSRLGGSFTSVREYGMQITSPYQWMQSKDLSNEHTVQADYINPFADGDHIIEAGAKAVWRRNNGLYDNIKGENQGNAIATPSDQSDIMQIQDIYAAYASYNGKFGNVSTNAGVRYEHTYMGIDYRTGDIPDFRNRLNDIVPNAALTYSFSMASNIRLAYQMRISRPSLKQVNPYQPEFMPNFIETGNPGLQSEKSNKVSLTYTNFGTVAGGNIGIEYAAIDNAISPFYYTKDDITYESVANIGHDRRLAFFGFFNWTIIPRMQVSVNARLTRQMFSSHTPDLKNCGWNLNYGANWNYSLASGFKFNLYGGQNTRNYNLQGYSNGWYYYGLGVSKDFLKENALTVSINANNFLQSHTNYISVVATDNLRTSSTYKNHNWNVGFSLSWNFGSLKSDVKKTDASINNDDKSSVGGKSQGGFN